MKMIMSINQKFFEYNAHELYDLVKEYSIDGFEIAIDYSNENHLKYLENLAYVCYQNNLIFQIHGDSSVSIEKQIEFIKNIENIYNLLKYKINIVLHPLTLETKESSIKETTKYLNEITKFCDNNKIIISLENLNSLSNNTRLNKYDITPIIANNENIYMTYDLGHEISEFGNITDINEHIIPLISNVHIHNINTNYSYGFDHKPISKDSNYWNQIIKGMLFLKKNKYEGPVVFEYDLYACEGDNLKEKIITYAKNIKDKNEYLNNK